MNEIGRKREMSDQFDDNSVSYSKLGLTQNKNNFPYVSGNAGTGFPTSMAATASSSSDTSADQKLHLLKQLKTHEVAIAELNSVSSSRAVYQRNGNLFFRTTIQKATAMEQKQLDSAKVKLKVLNASS